MTIEKQVRDWLVAHGLWSDEADSVIARCKAAPALEAMKSRWADRADGYPAVVFGTMLLSVKCEAVAWIDANKPHHFARALLV